MSLSNRIELENKIFARAHTLAETVCAKYGRLFSPSEDLQLQTMLYVYNKLFGEENFKEYCREREGRNVCQACKLPTGRTQVWGLKDFNFELALMEKL